MLNKEAVNIGYLHEIERAKFHFQTLNQAINKFLEVKPFLFMEENNYRTGETMYYTKTLRKIPVDVPLIMGDVIHNLRAALDILIFSFIGAIAQEPHKIQFPIARSDRQKAVEDAIIRGTNGAASPSLVNAIKALEPYPGGKLELYDLHVLDIQDKHQIIIPTAHTTRLNAKDSRKIIPFLSEAEIGQVSIVFQDTTRIIYEGGEKLSRSQWKARKDKGIVHTELELSPDFEICFPDDELHAGESVIVKIEILIANVEEACRQLMSVKR